MASQIRLERDSPLGAGVYVLTRVPFDTMSKFDAKLNSFGFNSLHVVRDVLSLHAAFQTLGYCSMGVGGLSDVTECGKSCTSPDVPRYQ